MMLVGSKINRRLVAAQQCRCFSLKDLIATLEKNGDGIKKPTTAPNKRFEIPSNISSGGGPNRFKPAMSNIQNSSQRNAAEDNAKAASTLGASVRESFRHASQYKNLNYSNSKQDNSNANSPPSTGGPGREHSGRDLYRSVGRAAAAATGENHASNIISELSGEDRYQRHQQALQMKSQQFHRNIPSGRERVHYNKNIAGDYLNAPPGGRDHYGNRYNGKNESLRELDMPVKKKKTAPVVTVKNVSLPTRGFITVDAIAHLVGSKKSVIETMLKKLDELPDNYSSDSSLFLDLEGENGITTSNEPNADGLTNKIDVDVAELVILELNRDDINVTRETSKESIMSSKHYYSSKEADPNVAATMVPRAPIVTIMGHVDHGKTTLLDSLRSGHTADDEAGGITQRLSAFTVRTKGATSDAKYVVFLDTPGHAAFQSMRTCGASATDLVVLVIACDDGIRPQTLEAAKTAIDANCEMIIAINKIDKIADLKERAKRKQNIFNKLVEHDITVEEYGGNIPVVDISAKTGDGLDDLMEAILLQSDVMELKAAGSGLAETTVLDARMEKGRGVIADVLVRWGSLSVGDNFVAGESLGRVKVMEDSNGRRIQTAGPSTPVRLMGFRSIPEAGSELLSVESEEKAKQIAERRQRMDVLRKTHEASLIHKAQVAAAELAKEELAAAQRAAGIVPEKWYRKKRSAQMVPEVVEPTSSLPAVELILKADGMGTLQALQYLVDNIASKVKDIVDVKVIRASVGDVTSSDVNVAATASMLTDKTKHEKEANVQAACSAATILGFNVNIIDSQTRSALKMGDVNFVRNTVIYRLEDHLLSMIQDYMPKEKIETVEVTTICELFELNILL